MDPTNEQIREAVREHYAGEARRVQTLQQASCCSPSACGCGSESTLYDPRQLAEIPEGAALASLGCGNPTLIAQLALGETVLDLGSGGGIDVLLSAKRVGTTGKAYGLDMTHEMLELARANAREARVENVEFLKGHIEAIPLPDASVDVIISNCVINLSADKDAVLREAYRVLKPGGRFAVADVVVQGQAMPAELRQLLALWAECVSGALTDVEYRAKLGAAGFEGVDIQVLSTFGLADVPEEYRGQVPQDLLERSDTKVISAFVRATKPGQAGPRERAERPAAMPLPVASQAPCCGPAAASASSCCSAAPTVEQVRGYFDSIAGKWDSMRAGFFTEEVRAEVLRRLVPHPDMRVADVGSGTGFLAAALAPRVAQVHCVDASPEMLDQARQNLADFENVRYHLSDGKSLPLLDRSVDAVVANMYLHHAPDPAAALREMARVLRQGGRLVLTDLDSHSEEWMRAEMADVWLGFDRGQVREWLVGAGLEQVDVAHCGQICSADRPDGGRATIDIFVAQARKPLAG